MAFLDNTGDIILDAVITDVGRKALAMGDGSFKITKFALGDDEINYSQYNLNHTGGTPYYDLEIMQTPVLESVSNSESSLKSKLLSYTNPNLWYLPELIWNTNENKSYGNEIRKFPYDPVKNAVVLTTTAGGVKAFGNTGGVLNGVNPGRKDSHIRIESGLNAPGKPPGQHTGETAESQFSIECDNRFCRITDLSGRPLNHSFLDENNIATYIVSSANNRVNGNVVTQMTQFGHHEDIEMPEMKWLRGPMVRFKVLASTSLQTGLPSEPRSLWAKHGRAYGATEWTTAAAAIASNETCGLSSPSQQGNNLQARAAGGTFYSINTTIRVSGLTTGTSIDIPIVIVKDVQFVTSCARA